MPQPIEVIATLLFVVAVLHTFSVPMFARLAHRGGPHAGFWHLLAEVEAVFGVCLLYTSNPLLFNIGLHTAHHESPRAHWSELTR